jgi:hypothetical protein
MKHKCPRTRQIPEVVIIIKTQGQDFKIYVPERIQVRIDPPHPLVCRKRRLNGVALRMRPEKPMSRVTAGVTR